MSIKNTALIAITLMSVGLLGCQAPQEVLRPRSNLTRAEAKDIALHISSKLGDKAAICGVKDTGSMMPLFHGNSWLVLETADFKDLGPGDIVIYQSQKGYPVVHQIVMRDSSGNCLVKGINNQKVDNEILTASNYNYRVAAILYYQESPAVNPMGLTKTAVAAKDSEPNGLNEKPPTVPQ